jgi:hypothetical protein
MLRERTNTLSVPSFPVTSSRLTSCLSSKPVSQFKISGGLGGKKPQSLAHSSLFTISSDDLLYAGVGIRRNASKHNRRSIGCKRQPISTKGRGYYGQAGSAELCVKWFDPSPTFRRSRTRNHRIHAPRRPAKPIAPRPMRRRFASGWNPPLSSWLWKLSQWKSFIREWQPTVQSGRRFIFLA